MLPPQHLPCCLPLTPHSLYLEGGCHSFQLAGPARDLVEGSTACRVRGECAERVCRMWIAQCVWLPSVIGGRCACCGPANGCSCCRHSQLACISHNRTTAQQFSLVQNYVWTTGAVVVHYYGTSPPRFDHYVMCLACLAPQHPSIHCQWRPVSLRSIVYTCTHP